MTRKAAAYVFFKILQKYVLHSNSGPSNIPREHKRENGWCIGSQSQYCTHCLWSSYSFCREMTKLSLATAVIYDSFRHSGIKINCISIMVIQLCECEWDFLLIWFMLIDASTVSLLMTITAIYRCVLNGSSNANQKAYRWHGLTIQGILVFFKLCSATY